MTEQQDKRPDADLATWWELAVHEAGHLVAAEELMHFRGRAVLLPGGGMADVNVPLAIQTHRQALIIACGQHAETLALLHNPPADVPEPQPQEPVPSRSDHEAEIAAKWTQAPNDFLRIFRWIRTAHPEHLKDIYTLLHGAARAFVAEHETRIVAIAQRLYRDGHVNLESDQEPVPPERFQNPNPPAVAGTDAGPEPTEEKPQ